jgi:hypothetical protein
MECYVQRNFLAEVRRFRGLLHPYGRVVYVNVGTSNAEGLTFVVRRMLVC